MTPLRALAYCLLFRLTDARIPYRIIGGIEADIKKVPYQLGLMRNRYFICGAALISEKYGLSAAHCFSRPGRYSVRAGSHFKDSNGVVMRVKNTVLHPNRFERKYQYDIAIMELADPLKLSDTIRPVKLPDSDKLLAPGMKGIVSGFGDTYNRQNTGSNVLRIAEIAIKNKDECQRSYDEFEITISASIFCAGGWLNHRTDSCQGDSGGPFVIDNVLYGLVSFGQDCGDPKHPGVYTNVAKFRQYIKLNTGI